MVEAEAKPPTLKNRQEVDGGAYDTKEDRIFEGSLFFSFFVKFSLRLSGSFVVWVIVEGI